MTYKLLVGGYTENGLRVLTFDPSSQDKLSVAAKAVPAGSSPSWIAAHPSDNSLIFAVNEVEDGRLLAIKLSGLHSDEVTGELVANVTSGGAYPAHLLALKDSIVVGNYTGGSILDVPYSTSPLHLTDTSRDKKEGTHVQFNGTGPNADRQEASHPHEVYAYENELLIPDLGADKVWRLVKEGPTGWKVKSSIDYPAGTGPRHILIHDEILYTVLELTSELSVQKFATLPDAPTPIITLSTFASGSPSDSSMLAAEILLSPNKKFVYLSNRNDPSPEGDTIAVFSTASSSEEYKLVREIRTGVKHARGMNFSPDGKYLAVAGSHSGSVKIFEVVDGSADGEVILAASVEGLEKPTAVIWL